MCKSKAWLPVHSLTRGGRHFKGSPSRGEKVWRGAPAGWMAPSPQGRGFAPPHSPCDDVLKSQIQKQQSNRNQTLKNHGQKSNFLPFNFLGYFIAVAECWLTQVLCLENDTWLYSLKTIFQSHRLKERKVRDLTHEFPTKKNKTGKVATAVYRLVLKATQEGSWKYGCSLCAWCLESSRAGKLKKKNKGNCTACGQFLFASHSRSQATDFFSTRPPHVTVYPPSCQTYILLCRGKILS